MRIIEYNDRKKDVRVSDWAKIIEIGDKTKNGTHQGSELISPKKVAKWVYFTTRCVLFL
jgi:hypothetical protein